MAKWRIYSSDCGNDNAIIKDTLSNGKEVAAYLFDCDGDCVTWSVMTDGKEIDGGEVWPEEVSKDPRSIQSEIDAWDEAKRRAEWVFCYQKPLVDKAISFANSSD